MAAGPGVLRRTASLLLPAALAGALAGCGIFGGSSDDLPALPAPTGAAEARIAWRVPVGAAGVGFAPTVVGNSVWAAAADGTVVRVDATSGEVFWRVDVGAPLESGVGSDGEHAVVVTRDAQVVALDGKGARLWSAPLGSAVTAVPRVGLGLALVRGGDDRVTAFDVDNGRVRWTYRRGGSPLALRHTAGLVVAPGNAFVGLSGGRLLALSLLNGAPRWEAAVAIPSGTTDIERLSDVVGTPILDGRELCAVTYQGRIGCLDAANGNPLWLRPFSSVSGLEVDPRFVFAVDDQSRVQAFSRSGAPAWRQEALARRSLTAPLSIGSMVALGDRFGLVHLLARSDGSVAARVATDGSAILAQPRLAQNRAVVQTADGGLFAVALD